MLKRVSALAGILALSLLGACTASVQEGVVTSSYGAASVSADSDDMAAYDPSVSYVAVAEYPDRLYYFSSGCGYGNWGCASYVPVRYGYWPANVNYYSTTTRTFVDHGRWVGYAGRHWNHGVLQAHSGWSHRGPAVRPGSGVRNVNYNVNTNTNTSTRGGFGGQVHHDGRPPTTQPVHRPPQGNTSPHRDPGPRVVSNPPRATTTQPVSRPAPRPAPAPARRCGGAGQPRC